MSWLSPCDDFVDLVRAMAYRSWVGLGRMAIELCVYGFWLAMPLVASLTLAMIPVRLLAPRPRLRRFTVQPGMMASCAAAVAIAFITLIVVSVR